MLTKDLPPEFEMPLAMSVQVVDDQRSWLVATAAHETEASYRDIYIENVDVAISLSNYYDRIWKVSEKLLDRGRITPEGIALLRRTAETS